MPKATKKKKEKAADFTKAKLKIGKGKQQANNAVDTSFKARSIALPTQSIAVQKGADAPTTKRRLTFEDLISHLKHYNATTRKDAIFGLRELLDAHSALINTNLTSLIHACVRLIGDEDASVRKALLSFFTWLLPQISREILIPHSPMLLLFTTSAQTHIFPEIRVDAIRFLDLFIEIIPDQVVSGWKEGDQSQDKHGARVLEGYLGILNAGTNLGGDGDTGQIQATSTASVVLSPGSKLAVLTSLSHFLKASLGSHHAPKIEVDTTIPTRYLESSFSSPEAYESFNNLLRLSSATGSSPPRTWVSEFEEGDEGFVGRFAFVELDLEDAWTLQELTQTSIPGMEAGPSSLHEVGSSSRTSRIAHVAHTLHSTLVCIYLDCAPAVFAPVTSIPSETELGLITRVAEITSCLYSAILQARLHFSVDGGNPESDAASEELKIILGYMAPYFPFTPDRGSHVKRDIKVEQTFQDLNLIFCELTSLLVFVSPDSSCQSTNARFSRNKRSASRGKSALSAGLAAAQLEDVCQYVIQLLQKGDHSASQGLSRPLTPATYVSILPTIWSLLNVTRTTADKMRTESFDNDKATDEVLYAIVEHSSSASSTSAVKRYTIEFVAMLILLDSDPQYFGTFGLGRSANLNKKFEEWVTQLPRTLWELGGSNLCASEMILRLLLRLSQRGLHQRALTTLHPRMIPYFSIKHPSRGKIPGPYARLPAWSKSSLRKLALDTMITICLPVVGTPREAELMEAVDGACEDTQEMAYWHRLKGYFIR